MRSHDLATLAQVTVRTLRHYHRVGVLPEPERSRNGYRDYTVHDLVRLLRIKRLAALGIPLEKMPAMLADETGSQTELLNQLDAEIDAEMARLQAQKTLIGLARMHDAAPDLPPALASSLARFAASGASPAMNRMDRDQVILLAHLAGEDGIDRLARVYGRLAEPDVLSGVAAVSRQFDDLADDASEREIDAMVAEFVARLSPLLADLDDGNDEPLFDEAAVAPLFDAYQADVLNRAQRNALAQVTERLQQLTEAPVDDSQDP
ncbi:MerR family transcriptional regulator [Cryobacterium sp. 1639]|uniref:MerR family transcriptional regulator n=1 Tax=Cryobacterium inferilacus TaxID=2866629 RepID=UPI001C72D985|nr:MerR family transcriptional regulator [Cryobacterium sp. 1639]MBX0299212.1 MerR family transcriptional regulator [Cryobacterium sp. 1639]